MSWVLGRIPFCWAVVVFLGCGASASTALPPQPGDAEADPRMITLPSADVPAEELTQTMRFGLALAEEAFGVEMPPPPPGGATADLEQWAEGDLRAWLELKSRTVDAARRELDTAAEESHRQRIMAGAVVGLMYEDVARRLSSLPVPAELASDPEIATIFREVIDAQASPFLIHARRAYGACAANADGGPEAMAHWAPYCGRRRSRLPQP